MTNSTTFRVHALPAAALDTVRRTGRDAADRPVESLRAGGGEALRCCLRDADEGEDLLLFGYAPPGAAGPYREIGPVFAHATARRVRAWAGRAERPAPSGLPVVRHTL
ncbi:DUF1203 domain-containing protein, partial [Micromonospora zamorensis]|uniref:DUF1203 domain-containing protein n=1 Tax=Micromonospora zamorensis TaxID=709883 RepID=UPI0033A2AFF9